MKFKRKNKKTDSKKNETSSRIIIAAKEFSEKTSDTVKKTRALDEKKKINIIISVILISFILQLLLVYYNSSSGTIRTQTVVYERQPISIDVNAYVIRDEAMKDTDDEAKATVGGMLIKKSYDGYYSNVVSDGEFVSKGQIIAYVFSTAEEKKRYDEYRNLLPNLEAMTQLGNSALDQVDESVLNVEILNLLRNYEQSSFTRSYDDNLRDVLSQLVLKIKTGGTEEDVAVATEKLKSEIKSLENSINFSQAVKAPCAGYFVAGVDGLESKIDYYDVEKDGIGVKKLRKLLKAKEKSSDKYYGKIVYQSNWFVSFEADADFVGEYMKRTSVVSVSFPDKDLNNLQMKIVKKHRKGKSVCVTMSCSEISADLLKLRNENTVITIKNPKGYKVLKDAIRTVDGVIGVFIKKGNRAIFKPVRELYSSDDYSIVCSLSGTEYISLYGEDKFNSFILDSTHENYEKSLNKAKQKDAENENLDEEDYEKKVPVVINEMYENDDRVIDDYDKIIVRGRNLNDRQFIN